MEGPYAAEFASGIGNSVYCWYHETIQDEINHVANLPFLQYLRPIQLQLNPLTTSSFATDSCFFPISLRAAVCEFESTFYKTTNEFPTLREHNYIHTNPRRFEIQGWHLIGWVTSMALSKLKDGAVFKQMWNIYQLQEIVLVSTKNIFGAIIWSKREYLPSFWIAYLVCHCHIAS